MENDSKKLPPDIKVVGGTDIPQAQIDEMELSVEGLEQQIKFGQEALVQMMNGVRQNMEELVRISSQIGRYHECLIRLQDEENVEDKPA